MDKFVNQNSVDLMYNLRNIVLDTPNKAILIIEKLEKTNRYKTDFEFSVVVMVQKISALNYMSKHEEVSKILGYVHEKVLKVKTFEIYVESISRLAGAYYAVGDIKQSITLFNLVYEYEKNNNKISERSAIALSSLGYIYLTYNKKEEGEYYSENALEIFNGVIDINLATEKQISSYLFILTNLIKLKVESGKKEDCIKYMNLIDKLDSDKFNSYAMQLYKQSKIYYFVFSKDLDNFMNLAQDYFYLMYEQNNYSHLAELILHIYEINKDYFKENPNINDFIIKKMSIALDKIEEKAIYTVLRSLYIIVIDYANSVNNDELLLKYYSKLGKINHLVEDEFKAKKEKTLDFFINLANKKENFIDEHNHIEKIAGLNEKLEEKNKELKSIYDKIRSIVNIGQKIVLIDNIKDLEKLLVNELSEIIPIDILSIVWLSDAKNEKFTVCEYGKFNGYNSNSIDINDDNFIEAKIFRNKKPLICNNFNETHISFLKDFDFDINDDYQSVIYYPLCKDGKFLGVFSIKHRDKNVYTDDDFKIIESIIIYISVSVYNAFKSKKIKNAMEIVQSKEILLKTKLEKNEKLSFIDPLTKVYNRYYFDNEFDNFKERAMKEKLSITMFLLDIDDFKVYNDKNGHLDGDKVLVSISSIIKNELSGKDNLVIRYGGEEFLGLSIGLTEKKVINKAEKIRFLVEKLNIKYNDGTDRFVSISIGVTYIKECFNIDRVKFIKITDDNLYRAKFNGKNCIVKENFKE